MKTHSIRRSGFSAVELILIVVVVAIIGALGYVAYNSIQNKNAESSKQADASTASDVEAVPVIESDEDLQKAEQTLDQANVESGNDIKQLDSELSAF